MAALFGAGGDRDFSYGMPDDIVRDAAGAAVAETQHKNFAELGARKFVRAPLPVRVADDGTERIGVWVEIAGADFARLVAVFWNAACVHGARHRGHD